MPLRFVAIALFSCILALLSAFHPTPSYGDTGIVAQANPDQSRFRVYDAWQLVYEQLPNFPQENQYVSAATGDVAEDNTLISRLVRYHVLIKGRSPVHRLDWKLTLADYLGVNEVIFPASYPGQDALQTNPMTGDVAVIQSLNRVAREQLISTLIGVFAEAGWTASTPTADLPSNSVSPPSSAGSSQTAPPSTVHFGTGAADLLLP
ncbi:MAG: hypothetical protein HC881_19145 [Leptolyngbyaceae cyanobacterium SL_7_1]|nr:hypothetical protein [Leptolyngbyaceae cyanobacterium SL_7_1]